MMSTGAIISPCGEFRYHLHRQFAVGPVLLLVMCNPSTADAEVDDPTIRRCIGFAQTLGFGGIEVVNLFAYRAVTPHALRTAGWPIGPLNDDWIKASANRNALTGGTVCCAWGATAEGLSRPKQVIDLIAAAGASPMCLEMTKGGHPAHPLYLPGATHLRPFHPKG